MSWFQNKRRVNATENVEKESRVEVIAHKKATSQQIAAVKRANQQLNNVLAANGFTLKIYLAAGGQHPASSKGK